MKIKNLINTYEHLFCRGKKRRYQIWIEYELQRIYGIKILNEKKYRSDCGGRALEKEMCVVFFKDKISGKCYISLVGRVVAKKICKLYNAEMPRFCAGFDINV